MGLGGGQGSQGHQDLRERYPRAHGPIRRLPHHLRFCPHQAAHLQGAGNGQAGVPQVIGSK